jgi:hypothetical protein
MFEASSRILVDRTVIRLDGRPHFAFGPRILLTPPERYNEALRQIAADGFTTVGTPPASHGTLELIDDFLRLADQTTLTVIVYADPRARDLSRSLPQRFRHHPSLLGYLLPPLESDEHLASYTATRDAFRSDDLFHPIWSPIPADRPPAPWLRAQDIVALRSQQRTGAAGRLLPTKNGEELRRFLHAQGAPGKPLVCVDLPVFTTDRERATGIFEDDPAVRHGPNNSLEWYPWLTPLEKRKDLIEPTPELLRLQVYSLWMAGTRGIIFDFYEGLLGEAPFTGRDRYGELVLLAQEAAVLRDFLAEGKHAPIEVDSGHPRLQAVPIQHGHETLILLRMDGYEDEFFVDESVLERAEVSVNVDAGVELTAWRMDFPRPRKLDIIRDSTGSIRFIAGEIELTGLLLLTPGRQRVEDLTAAMEARLPAAARWCHSVARIRLSKIEYVENDLMALGVAVDNRDRLKVVQQKLAEAARALEAGAFEECWNLSRLASRYLRRIVKYQMAKALAMPLLTKGGKSLMLRNQYSTLPRFYRENTLETQRVYADIT